MPFDGVKSQSAFELHGAPAPNHRPTVTIGPWPYGILANARIGWWSVGVIGRVWI